MFGLNKKKHLKGIDNAKFKTWLIEKGLVEAKDIEEKGISKYKNKHGLSFLKEVGDNKGRKIVSQHKEKIDGPLAGFAKKMQDYIKNNSIYNDPEFKKKTANLRKTTNSKNVNAPKKELSLEQIASIKAQRDQALRA